MTTPYNPRTPINELHDMIDKHVPQAEARLQIHYDKAAETRALLKRLGCWPAETKHKAQPPRKKAEGHGSVSMIARMAYDWARKHDKTTNEAAEECPDGPQYKAAGNSMAVPCMRWIGKRIADYEAKA